MELREGNPGGGAVVGTNDTRQFASTNQLTSEQVSKSDEALGRYDPFLDRKIDKPTSDYGALAHLLKSSLGSGILAMPLAFQHGGLTFGMIGTLVAGAICTHCVQMLVDSSHVLCRRAKRPMLGFAETAEVAFSHGPPSLRRFASTASVCVNSALTLTYFMGMTVYVVFISTTVQQGESLIISLLIFTYHRIFTKAALVSSYFGACAVYLILCSISVKEIVENLNPDFLIDIRLYILMLYVPLLILSLVKDLKDLVPFSIVADACIVVVFGITLYYMVDDIPDPDNRAQIASYDQIPLFFSTVIFAMEGIGTVMPIENTMKTPQHFTGCPGVLNIAMVVVVLLYAVVGFLGYLKYGDATEGSITLNILKENKEDIAAQVVQYLIAIAIFFTYALQFVVPSGIIWDAIKDKFDERRHTLYIYIMRFIVVTGTVVLAIAVPNLGPIISLVGAVCFSILGLLLPSIIDTVTRWEEGFGPGSWMLWKNIIISVLSILALLSGSYASILEIIDTY